MMSRILFEAGKLKWKWDKVEWEWGTTNVYLWGVKKSCQFSEGCITHMLLSIYLY